MGGGCRSVSSIDLHGIFALYRGSKSCSGAIAGLLRTDRTVHWFHLVELGSHNFPSLGMLETVGERNYEVSRLPTCTEKPCITDRVETSAPCYMLVVIAGVIVIVVMDRLSQCMSSTRRDNDLALSPCATCSCCVLSRHQTRQVT